MSNEKIINGFFEELEKNKRPTNGRDTSKTYHKITISVSHEEKQLIQKYASDNHIKVSALIKNSLRDKNII